METPQLTRIIEAALLAASHPLTIPQLAGLFDEFDMPPPDQLAHALQSLQEDCAGRGVELVEVASGFRYQVRREEHALIARLWAEKPSRYSRALLETLALIAYRQPITRAEIEAIRGVAVSTHIVRTLEEREWVRVVGHRDLPGRPALFGTTRQFLDYFQLKSLEELPTLGEIHDLEDIEQQLAFDGIAPLATAPIAIDADPADAAEVIHGETLDATADEDVAHAVDADFTATDSNDPGASESLAAPAADQPRTPETSP